METETPVAAQEAPHHWRNRIVLGVICAIGIAGALYAYQKKDGDLTTKHVSLTGETYFRYHPRNFEMQFPPGWGEVSTSSIKVPAHFGETLFVFTKQSASCGLAFTLADSNWYDHYRQAFFADRIFSTEAQFDDSYYVPKGSGGNSFTFGVESNRALLGQVRVTGYPQFYNNAIGENKQYLFVFFDLKGGVVSGECDKDFSKIEQSLKESYQKDTLTADSTGLVYFSNAPGLGGQGKTQLLFIRDGGDGIPRLVANPDVEWILDPVVYQNTLYVLRNGTIQTYDLITGSFAPLPNLDIPKEQVVNEFYFNQGRLFYLAGADCLGYKETCNLKLYEYSLQEKKATVLAENVKSRIILGYSADENVLHMYYGEGDAGCFWAQDERYDFSSGMLKEGEDYSGCIGEEEGDENSDKLQALLDKYMGGKATSTAIRIGKGGILSKPVLEPGDPGNHWKILFER